MDQFEHDLKFALRKVDPPAGFEGRVLTRLRAEPEPRAPWRFTAWAAAAGLAFASFAGIALYQQQQQQRRAREARDQLLLALRVTGQKLDVVRTRLNTHSSQMR